MVDSMDVKQTREDSCVLCNLDENDLVLTVIVTFDSCDVDGLESGINYFVIEL